MKKQSTSFIATSILGPFGLLYTCPFYVVFLMVSLLITKMLINTNPNCNVMLPVWVGSILLGAYQVYHHNLVVSGYGSLESKAQRDRANMLALVVVSFVLWWM